MQVRQKKSSGASSLIQPRYPAVHLWDGGAYDNHGLEGIHDFTTGWSKRFGFLIVSDAAGRPGEEVYRKGIPTLMRLASGIMMAQVRSLRTRAILERLQNHAADDQGVFLQMGNTFRHILDQVPGMPAGSRSSLPAACRKKRLLRAAATPTVIRQLTPEEYERLYHHGYEVADATLCAYYPQIFQHVAYGS